MTICFFPEKLARFSQVVEADPKRAWYAPTYVDRGVSKRWVRPDRAIGPDEDMGIYLFVANQFVQTSTLVAPTASRVLCLSIQRCAKGRISTCV